MSTETWATLSNIADHPELVDRVSPSEAHGLMLRAAALVSLLATRASQATFQPPAAVAVPPPGPDTILKTREAAALIGITPGALRRSWREKYLHLTVPTESRSVRFSRRKIEEWQQSGTAGSPHGTLSRRGRYRPPSSYPWEDTSRPTPSRRQLPPTPERRTGQ